MSKKTESTPKKTTKKKSSTTNEIASTKKKSSAPQSRTGLTKEDLAQSFQDNILFAQAKLMEQATLMDKYFAQAIGVKERLIERWVATQKTYANKKAKRVYYLSAEFLMGRLLANNLLNLGITEPSEDALKDFNLTLQDLEEQEPDAGLGNGGLGRLAACFLDSIATLGYPGTGYGIRYEFGIFKQIIQNGEQIEQPDEWLKNGNPWEIRRPEYTTRVRFGGRTEAFVDNNGKFRVRWVDTKDVYGVPYDTPIPGYQNKTVNNLRLWSAQADQEFDFKKFDDGDYEAAVQEKIDSENISKVLYPNDNSMQGKELRFKQQYFFVACSLSDIVRRYLTNHKNFNKFPEQVCVQLNDTHPAIAIAELMRILLDEQALSWEQAWDITTSSFAYTNHTLLPEALEQWPLSFFERLLPRHLEIIREIDLRFLYDVAQKFPKDPNRILRMAIIDGNPQQVRMAHLAVVGSFSVNGVAELHTELLKTRVLKDFADLWPHKFNNKTNGVTPRRWIFSSNPGLTELISSAIGTEWMHNLDKLDLLEEHIEKPAFIKKFQNVKLTAKKKLAAYIKETLDITVDTNSIFDIHIKRFHEYKRQHLNALHIIHLYNKIKQNPKAKIVPRTFIFAGKSAPGYFLAKRIIHLIHAIADTINNDPDVADRIKVVFLPNYNVSLGELLFPAADVSEQISTAGYEASGTGNMKFALNGAITIGTLDGANVEIRQCVGHENFFLFGLTAEEVQHLKASKYKPISYLEQSPDLHHVIDRLVHNHFNPDEPGAFHSLLNEILGQDRFMVMADFDDYVSCQERVSEAFMQKKEWAIAGLRNIARCGKFSSDRTIKQYAEEIWGCKSINIQ